MDVFNYRDRLIGDYASFVRSFIAIRDARVKEEVDREVAGGLLWPEPLIQLNPAFEPASTVSQLADRRVLHDECDRIFRLGKERPGHDRSVRLYRHQEEAIEVARTGASYVLTTGTGSGKSLAYIIPIVDAILREGPGQGVKAIIVYPMNALANSQAIELDKFINLGYPDGRGPVRYARYTGQEQEQVRQEIIANPPDILLTNYVMLELMLTRPRERQLIESANGLRFLVLDELHTYRGRQGADVAMLVRRVRDRLGGERLQCVGTSATMASAGTYADRQKVVAEVATRLFGTDVGPSQVIGETLRRATPERTDGDPTFRAELKEIVSNASYEPPATYEAFCRAALASWVESTFGIRREKDSERLERNAYRDAHLAELDDHILALESDGGVFTPSGFGFSGSDEAMQIIRSIATLLEPIGAGTIRAGGGGADIGPIVNEGVPAMSPIVDSAHYFDVHHTDADTMDKIDPRDIQLNVAAMAVMVYTVANWETRLPR